MHQDEDVCSHYFFQTCKWGPVSTIEIGKNEAKPFTDGMSTHQNNSQDHKVLLLITELTRLQEINQQVNLCHLQIIRAPKKKGQNFLNVKNLYAENLKTLLKENS